MNTVCLVGNLARDPEGKDLPSGDVLVNFTIAINNGKNKEGAERPVDFISCKAFGKTAQNLVLYQKKGMKVGVEGRLKSSSYEKDGQKVYKMEVVADSVEFLSPKKEVAE